MVSGPGGRTRNPQFRGGLSKPALFASRPAFQSVAAIGSNFRYCTEWLGFGRRSARAVVPRMTPSAGAQAWPSSIDIDFAVIHLPDMTGSYLEGRSSVTVVGIVSMSAP